MPGEVNVFLIYAHKFFLKQHIQQKIRALFKQWRYEK